MKIKFLTMLVVLVVFQLSSAAQAVPFLQLDVKDGVYVDEPEATVTATTNPFTLYALVDSTNKNDYEVDKTYYISIALIPGDLFTGNEIFDFGTFSFAGNSYAVNNTNTDFDFGTPPADTTLNKDQIGSHGIYDTYYVEVGFTLSGDKSLEYNSQDTPGGLNPDSNGTLFYKGFVVDISSLAEGYGLHFDLYTKNTDGSVDKFAPFSHDAQSGGGDPVPEPATMLLFGAGLAGLAGSMKKRRK